MKKKVIVFVIMIITSGLSHSLELNIEDNYGLWRGKIWSIYDTNDLFKSTALNLLDENDDTPSLIYFSAKNTNEYPAFDVYFKDTYPVDEIVIKNGNISNTNYLYIKEIRVITSEKKISNGIDVTNEITNGSIILNDTAENQVFNTDRPVEALKWRFEVLSVYSGYNDGLAALSGIEFWNGGKKYSITNIDDVKKKFIQGYRDEQLGWIANMYYFVREVTYRGGAEIYARRWDLLGVDVKNIEMIVKESNLTVNLEFTTNGKYDGNILAGKQKGRIVWKMNKYNRHKYYHFEDYVKLGEWKLDENGCLWIKAGNGVWKKEDGFMSFNGTDLEGISSVMSVDF